MKMRSSLVGPAASSIIVAFSMGLSACGGGGGSSGAGGGGGGGGTAGGRIALTGTLAGGSGSSNFRGASALEGTADPAIDEVIAIPMERGSLTSRSMPWSVTSSIGADGSFSLSLDKEMDWLLVLVNSSATGTGRFVGSVAMRTATADSLLNLPATDATLGAMSLGTVSRPTSGTTDAVSSETVAAESFGMTATQLLAMAKNDDLFKNAMNIVNNYETFENAPGSGRWYQLRPDFHWQGDLGALVTTDLGSAPALTYSGMNFQLDQNVDAVTMDDVCNTAGVVALHPPASAGDVTMGERTYSYTVPIANSGAGCHPWNGTAHRETTGSDIYASDGYEHISFSVIGSFASGAIPQGFWEWKEHGVLKAAFDIASINPPVTSSGELKGFVPAYKVVTEPAGTRIVRVDLAWFYYDGATYTKIDAADLKILKHFVNGIEAKFDVTDGGTRRTCEMYIDPSTETSFDPRDARYASTCQADALHSDWYYDDPTHPETNTGMMGFYESGGFGYFFDFFRPR